MTAQQLRDFLLPALYARSLGKMDYAAYVQDGYVIISGRNKALNKCLGFAISPDSIASGRWKAGFVPTMGALARSLKQG